MNFKLQKIDLSKFNYLKYINRLTIIIAFLIFGYLGYFIYFNLYGTIAEAQQVVLLKQEVAPESLDIPKIQKVLAQLEKRATSTSSINIEKIRNLFSIKSTPDQITLPIQATTTN